MQRDSIFTRFIGLVFLLVATVGQAQQYPSMNNQQLPDTVVTDFDFLVGGHFYGSAKVKTGIPAASVLANLEMMNNSGAHFLAHVGDIFSNSKKDIPGTKKAFIDRLNFPIYNAVGDHDLSSRNTAYRDNFGKTYFNFYYQKNAFLFLDSDTDDSTIKDEQLDLFKEVIKTSASGIANVFIFSHRPIWSEGHEQLDDVFVNNNRARFSCNFQEELLPILKTIPSTTNVYWFSGSIGPSYIPFFYYVENEQFHYIQTSVKEKPNDAMLHVSVKQGEVKVTPLPLTIEPIRAIDGYSLDEWKSQASTIERDEYILWLKNMVFHQYFWFGAGMVLLANFGWFILKWLRARRQKKLV